MIQLTPEAVAEVKRMMQKDDRKDIGLRIGVKDGGCNGLSYTMILDAQKEGDEISESEGVRIYSSGIFP